VFWKYHAHLVPIIIEIKIMGETAVEYGWHELTLTPKAGGEPVKLKDELKIDFVIVAGK
jgi:hypothetical protein